MHEKHNWHDAMAARLAQYVWTSSDSGKKYLDWLYQHNVGEYVDHPNIVSLMRGLFQTEPLRLQGATPFFVSADMCELITFAAASFKPEAIYPTDLLKLQGFMWYEEPLEILDRYERPMQIRAVSWQPVMDAEDTNSDRLLTRDDEVREYLTERMIQGKNDGLAITLYADDDQEWPPGFIKPPCTPFHITGWWWGMAYEGNEVTVGGRPTGADWWWKTIQTTWRLMQQHITVRSYEQSPRSQRREAQRLDVSGDQTVVIRLRRESSSTNGTPTTEMHYSHRFVVGWPDGFWRSQHYPSLGPAKLPDGTSDPNTHRQIWIAPFEKGPEGAPLIIKPNRVFNFNR